MTINYQFPYYPYTQFPGQPGYNQLGGTPYSNQYQSSFRPFENSYIENILRLNLGKTATIYMNFENSQWGSKIFKGELVGAGRDHILLKDNQTNVTYLLLRIYLCYVSFDEDIEYEYRKNVIVRIGTICYNLSVGNQRAGRLTLFFYRRG